MRLTEHPRVWDAPTDYRTPSPPVLPSPPCLFICCPFCLCFSLPVSYSGFIISSYFLFFFFLPSSPSPHGSLAGCCLHGHRCGCPMAEGHEPHLPMSSVPTAPRVRGEVEAVAGPGGGLMGLH